MKKRQELLTDEQWQLIEPVLPKPKRRRDKRGRPPASNRACFEGILWILQTGAAWRFLPDESGARMRGRRSETRRSGRGSLRWSAVWGIHCRVTNLTLRTRRCERRRRPHALPGSHWLGRTPAQCTDRSSSERQALKGPDSVLNGPFNQALVRSYRGCARGSAQPKRSTGSSGEKCLDHDAATPESASA